LNSPRTVRQPEIISSCAI